MTRVFGMNRTDGNWKRYADERPRRESKVEWITPRGEQVRGTYLGGGILWIPEGESMYIYYTPAFWRYQEAEEHRNG